MAIVKDGEDVFFSCVLGLYWSLASMPLVGFCFDKESIVVSDISHKFCILRVFLPLTGLSQNG